MSELVYFIAAHILSILSPFALGFVAAKAWKNRRRPIQPILFAFILGSLMAMTTYITGELYVWRAKEQSSIDTVANSTILSTECLARVSKGEWLIPSYRYHVTSPAGEDRFIAITQPIIRKDIFIWLSKTLGLLYGFVAGGVWLLYPRTGWRAIIHRLTSVRHGPPTHPPTSR
jgi:hypothetical protein